MREFVLFSRKGRTDSRFTSLRDAGRLDVVYECIVASLFLSHGLRRNVIFNASLNGPPSPPLHMEVDGSTLSDVRTDQETWKEILKTVLSGRHHQGIGINKDSFEKILKEKSENARVYVLEEDGKDIEATDIADDSIFVLGDHIGLPKTVENYTLRYGEKISLGKQPYLAASCITILNFTMDKRGVL